MSSRRNPLFLLMAAALIALAPACGGDDEPGGGGDGTGSGDQVDTGNGDTDNVPDVGTDTPEADTTPDVGTDTDETDTPGDDTSDASDDVSDPDGGFEGCRSDDECPARHECIDGICLKLCAGAVDCDDQNPCTAEACVDGYCEFEAIEPNVADAVAGDCRTVACVDGGLQEVADPTDLPEDDGISCTVERCAGQFPQHYADHTLCDDGDDLNGYETCSPPDGGCVNGENPPWVCDEFFPGWEREEICGDGQDNDGNGQADDGCPCEFGSAQRCFLGAPNARDVGGCVDGFQRCQNRDAPAWSECEGGILPSEEICDAKDNDCNGCVDDIEDCVPLLTCPTEDFARPLRDYPLDGTAIFEGRGLEWEWNVVPPPNSATRNVADPSSATTTVYLDVSGDYQISLTVRDDKGDLYGCSWVVHAAGSGLRTEMRWNTFGSVDMDLHVARPPGPFCDSRNDCYFANCRVYSALDWGYPPSPATECVTELGASTCPNPRLDIDNIRGFDPENINLDNPNHEDSFRVMAHMYSGSASTDPVISIYCGGRLAAVLGEAPDGAGMRSAGGGCGGQTWRVADVTMIVDDRTGFTDCFVDVLTDADGEWDIRTGTSAW